MSDAAQTSLLPLFSRPTRDHSPCHLNVLRQATHSASVAGNTTAGIRRRLLRVEGDDQPSLQAAVEASTSSSLVTPSTIKFRSHGSSLASDQSCVRALPGKDDRRLVAHLAAVFAASKKTGPLPTANPTAQRLAAGDSVRRRCGACSAAAAAIRGLSHVLAICLTNDAQTFAAPVMRQPVVRFTGSEAAILIHLCVQRDLQLQLLHAGFVAQPATSLAERRQRTNDASDVGFQPARSTAGNVCCLLTKIEAAQHPAIARHTVRIALQQLQHHTNGTQSPQHLQHTISTASTALLDSSTSHHRETSKMAAQTPQTTGDFTNKQFSEQEVANKVIEQYSEAHARTFYKYVMGGGGYDIHYGMFRTATDGVFESSKNTNAALLRLLDQTRPVTKESVVLDLGSATVDYPRDRQTFGCKVIFNISPEQNQMNLDEAKRLGVGELISVRCGDFNDRANFPPSDLGEVTHVISCEVFCHAASKPNLLADVRKIVQPGAALVFTDIMGADGADEKALKDFTDRNATTAMARPSQYLDWLKAAGFCHVGFFDGSGHLLPYFSAMLDVCHKQGAAMVNDGVPQPYLDKWIASLTDRVAIQKDKAVFAWGLFSARAPGPLY